MAAGAIALALYAGMAHGQDVAQPEAAAPTPSAPAWLGGLNADGLADRDRASSELCAAILACDLSGLPHVARLVEVSLADLAGRSDLSIEQRRRIVAALRERFMNTPRAAMGISFSPRGDAGVEVMQLTPGFPAAEQGALQVGDVIVEIAGESVEGISDRQARQDRLRELIVSHDPGERVMLKVVRPLTPRIPRDPVLEADRQQGVREPPLVTDGPNANALALEIEVPLGDYNELGNRAIALTEPLLETAWQFRARRIGLSNTPTKMLETTLGPDSWRRPERRARRIEEPGVVMEGAIAEVAALEAADREFLADAARREQIRLARLREPIVLQGGAVVIRGGEGVIIQDLQQQRRRPRPAPVVRRAPDLAPPAPVEVRAVPPPAPDPALDLAHLERRITLIQEAMKEHERRINDPESDERTREGALVALMALEQELTSRLAECEALRVKLAMPGDNRALNTQIAAIEARIEFIAKSIAARQRRLDDPSADLATRESARDAIENLRHELADLTAQRNAIQQQSPSPP